MLGARDGGGALGGGAHGFAPVGGSGLGHSSALELRGLLSCDCCDKLIAAPTYCSSCIHRQRQQQYALSNTSSYDLLWVIISDALASSSDALVASSGASCRVGACNGSAHGCSPGALNICSALSSIDGAPNNEAALGSGGSLSDRGSLGDSSTPTDSTLGVCDGCSPIGTGALSNGGALSDGGALVHGGALWSSVWFVQRGSVVKCQQSA